MFDKKIKGQYYKLCLFVILIIRCLFIITDSTDFVKSVFALQVW